MLRAVLVVAAAGALTACAGGASRHVTPEGEVIAENLLLPFEAGSYHMYRVDDRNGTVVRYVPPDSLEGRLPPVDVSVYTARHPLSEEAAMIRASAMQRDRNGLLEIDGTVYTSEGPVIVPASGDTIYRAIIDMTVSTMPHRQMLYIHQVGGRYVNISTTFVRVRGLDLEPLFDQIASEIVARTRVAPE